MNERPTEFAIRLAAKRVNDVEKRILATPFTEDRVNELAKMLTEYRANRRSHQRLRAEATS